jgi:hypothetical protein
MLIEKYPNIYGPGQYEYGKEPRNLVVKETLVMDEQKEESFVTANSLSSSETAEDVVMGITINRLYEYSRVKSLQACLPSIGCIDLATASLEFKAGLNLALRLPVTVELETPSELTPGNTYVFSSSVTPRNFDSADYERLGIPALDGREFAAEGGILLKARLDIIFDEPIEHEEGEFFDVGDICREQYNIECENFVTPFGVDENGVPREFPIPQIFLSPEDTGLMVPFSFTFILPVTGWIGIGIRIDPDFGSDKITAVYLAGDAAQGNGTLTYTAANPVQFDFGPITVDDSQDIASVSLDDYKFHVDRMMLEFAANLQSEGCVVLIICLPYFVETGYLDIFEFNLASVLGEPAIHQHAGTTGITKSIPVIIDKDIFCGRTMDSFDNIIFGTNANETLKGTPGDDLIRGWGGDDIIYGKGGNDCLKGDDGEDMMWGGDGDDVLRGGNDNDKLVGDAGNDILNGHAGNDAIWGSAGNDTLLGEIGSDLLVGDSGNDTIWGGDDSDKILGEDGNDTAYGDNGNDMVYGQLGDDLLAGGSEDDIVVGGMGMDMLIGDSGNDKMWGNSDNDILYDDVGDDLHNGEAGDDNCYDVTGNNKFLNCEGKADLGISALPSFG